MISFEKIGTSAIQSRACAGVAGGTYLFALPGSPGACRDAWDGILAAQLDISVTRRATSSRSCRGSGNTSARSAGIPRPDSATLLAGGA